MKSCLALISALLIASPALSQTTGDLTGSGALLERSPSDEPQGTSERGGDEDGERRICRRISATETRMSSRRVCMTAREWREHQRGN